MTNLSTQIKDFITELLSLGGGDNQVETDGRKKMGICLVKWMGEDKDVYRRKVRGGCVGYVLLICCSKHGNDLFFTPVFPIPDLGLSLILASLSLTRSSKAGASTSAVEDLPPPQHVGVMEPEHQGSGLFPHNGNAKMLHSFT